MKNSLRLLLALAVAVLGAQDGSGQCVITCPPGSVAEGEPCPIPINHINGGCDAPIPTYSPIEFDTPVCGRSRWIGNFKDTDWYEFHLPFPGIVTWTVQAEFGFEARIVTHECPASLLASGVAPACSTLSIRSTFLPADTYAVVVLPIDSGFSVCRDYVGTLTRRWQPDNCGSIIVIPEVPFIDSASTVGATDDYHCGGNTSPDVNYSLVAPATGWYLITLCESLFDTRLEVRTGGACPGDTEVACNDNGCAIEEQDTILLGPQSQLDILLDEGVTYYIIVDGSGVDDVGSYVLEVEEAESLDVPQRVSPYFSLYPSSQNWIASDCLGNLYGDGGINDVPYLHVFDAAGNTKRLVPMLMPDGSHYHRIDEISWDEDNCTLWGLGANLSGTSEIYKIDPLTGLCTFQFNGIQVGGAGDGLAYDPSDGTIWECRHDTDEAYHLDPANAGQQIGSALQPYRKIMGVKWRYRYISGVCAVSGGRMYIALPERKRIVLINKATGEKISKFRTSYGFLEGLECDPVNFGSSCVLWNNTDSGLHAYTIDASSCECVARGRCCYCENGIPSCERLTEPECDALGGNWLYPATCDTPCTNFSPIQLDPFPVGTLTCDPCGVPQPLNFTFTLYIRNTSPAVCNDLAIQILQTGTGPGGSATITSPTTFNIGSLNGHGIWSEFVDVSLDQASLNPNGGCINFTVIVNSSCCGPDTVDYCIEIPPCECSPGDDVDYEFGQDPYDNDTCSQYPASLLCPGTVCGAVYPLNDEDWYHVPVAQCTRLTVEVYGNDAPNQCAFGRGLNPQVQIYSETGSYNNCIPAHMGTDDGSGGGDYRHLSLCLEGGSYFVRITGLNNTVGPYNFTIACEPCQCFCPYQNLDAEIPGNDNEECSVATYFCPLEGCSRIAPAGDVDWYEMYRPYQCTEYTVEVHADPSAGNLIPRIEFLAGPNWLCSTMILATSCDNLSGSRDCQVVFCLPSSAAFANCAFRVTGVNNTVGPYTLRVTCSPCVCNTSCPVNCLPGYRMEGEPPCGTGYVDNYNGACGTPTPGYQQLSCGDTICGESGAYTSGGGIAFDRDLYAVTLIQRDTLKWSVVADSWARIMIVTPGMIGCSQEEQQVHASTSGSLCDTLRVSACLDPGTYWLSVQPINALKACGTAEYLAWVSCAPCFCDATQEIVLDIEDPYQCCCVDLSTGQIASKIRTSAAAWIFRLVKLHRLPFVEAMSDPLFPSSRGATTQGDHASWNACQGCFSMILKVGCSTHLHNVGTIL